MSNLQVRKTEDGLELVVDNTTGEVFATISGYARMSGKTQPAITARCKLDKFHGIKTAELPTKYGVKLHKLIPSDIVFLWMMKDNLELALAMGKAGAVVYMQRLAGIRLAGDRCPIEAAYGLTAPP